MSLRAQAKAVIAITNEREANSLEHLKSELAKFRAEVRMRPEMVADIRAEFLGAIVEAGRRRLGLFAHEEQVMATLTMLDGNLAEVATGEGKTLSIAMTAVIHAWTRRPCHVVTANDYLAERDAKNLSRFFDLCGVTCGYVVGEMSPQEREEQYFGDVVYTTAKELAADYLRDELTEETLNHPGRRLIRQMYRGVAASENQRVLRGLHTVIVDEADNGLIDEAVTPLIISQPKENKILEQAAIQAFAVAAYFENGVHYETRERERTVKLLEPGYQKVSEASGELPGMWQGTTRRVEMIQRALEAREFFIRDKQYVVEDGKIVIVDESTGRRMPGRSWRQGLHQAVEAKEGVEISSPAETVASISFQRFFRQFHVLTGATGTANEAAAELWRVYRLRVSRIPLHKPCRRVEFKPHITTTMDDKWNSIIRECAIRHEQGQPVLVGTRNVKHSETLAAKLAEKGLSCQVLNAVRHRDEATIIASAGKRGHITIATNMAGRGTDIKIEPDVRERGGLCVIATEWHDSARVDRQLYGRCGRQGDPGEVQTFLSLEDDLVEKYLRSWVRNFFKSMRSAKRVTDEAGSDQLSPSDEPRMIDRVIRIVIRRCQRRSERDSFRQREAVLRADEERSKSLGFASKG